MLFLAAEAVPFMKVGGLGDVAGTLPRALRHLAEAPDVRLVLPFHGNIDQTRYTIKPTAAFTIAHVDGPKQAQVFESEAEGLPAYLISGESIFPDSPVYSSDGVMDGNKFVFFSLAALELARSLDWQPDILHAHDWHTAAAVYCVKINRMNHDFFQHTATLLTVHNLPFLGDKASPALSAYGLPPAMDSGLPDWAVHMPLPLGLFAADKINSVSPGYAAEMLTPEFGSGLDDFLNTRKDDLAGILNGLDIKAWDPKTDTEISQNFDVKTLSQRYQNKLNLQMEIGLKADRRAAVFCIISRMDHQKGIVIALQALRQIAEYKGEQEWQTIILGTGDAALEDQAQRLMQDYPDKVKTFIEFDNSMARKLYAGADMILIPSRYEPCGLTQMISMRYGCVPIARATGGLKDTIIDHNEDAKGTGFLFQQADADDLAQTILRALRCYGDQRGWRGLQSRGMRQNFSWNNAAKQYMNLYGQMMKERQI